MASSRQKSQQADSFSMMDSVTLIDRSRYGMGAYHDASRRDTPTSHMPLHTSYSGAYPPRYPASHSPPYQTGESNKPSLPSLKTVLGESGMSPPATPPSHGISLQPLPREPLYDQSTYKPPSLYPHKRTRTEHSWDSRTPERTFAESGSRTLPYMSAPRLDDSTRARTQLDQSNRHIARSRLASPDIRSQRTDLSRSVHPYKSPVVGRPEVLPTPEPTNHRLSMYSNASSVSSQEEDPHRRSTYGEGLSPRERYAVEPPRQPYMPVSANTTPREEYSPMSRLEAPQGYGNAPYPYSHAFFVPSHYEYQNGKSRKRSNLPKQSTEIMKRWFDENMHNPYPSEEQKRHFAAIAGINLTQVSNWFINHRRRCPELREKRDKSRAGSRDDDM